MPLAVGRVLARMGYSLGSRDLSVVSKREYVYIQFPMFGVLLSLVAEPSDNCAVVLLDLTISVLVVRRCVHSMDPMSLEKSWKNREVSCLPFSDRSIRGGP